MQEDLIYRINDLVIKVENLEKQVVEITYKFENFVTELDNEIKARVGLGLKVAELAEYFKQLLGIAERIIPTPTEATE